MKLKLICCEIFYREACYVASRSKNRVDVEFLPKGMHDLESGDMRLKLQAAIDRNSDSDYDYLLLGYALCNNGTAGLTAASKTLVIPKAHDCITLFLGSRKKYSDYFSNNPGVYFYTSGWIERGDDTGDLQELSIQHKTGMDKSYEELVREYGEDNAKYLYETLCQGTKNYSKLTFIEMGVGPDDKFEKAAVVRATKNNWKFEKVKGDISLFTRLLDGPWVENEFLLVPPGYKIAPSYGDDVLKSVKR
ncbi:MAG: hypothetical protein A2017_05080 [Lentisphaerae bacterium GWF2_44_16]|nr:MAG: hypothetical protein A2017_05080 [Lentisphaerae bacterium GWF2_44_16]